MDPYSLCNSKNWVSYFLLPRLRKAWNVSLKRHFSWKISWEGTDILQSIQDDPLYQHTLLSASKQHRPTVTFRWYALPAVYCTLQFCSNAKCFFVLYRFIEITIYRSVTLKLRFDNTAISFRLHYFRLHHTQKSGSIKCKHDSGTSRSWFENRTINIMCLKNEASGFFGILIPIYKAAYPTRPQYWWKANLTAGCRLL